MICGPQSNRRASTDDIARGPYGQFLLKSSTRKSLDATLRNPRRKERNSASIHWQKMKHGSPRESSIEIVLEPLINEVVTFEADDNPKVKECVANIFRNFQQIDEISRQLSAMSEDLKSKAAETKKLDSLLDACVRASHVLQERVTTKEQEVEKIKTELEVLNQGNERLKQTTFYKPTQTTTAV